MRASQVAHLDLLHVSPADLAEMVCGPRPEDSGFAVRDVFQVMLDEQLRVLPDLGGSAPLADALWRVLDRWPLDLKRSFVAFVTASSHLPPPGTELLRVELPFVALTASDSAQQLTMLPQAHSCENLLELPNYWAALVKRDGRDASLDELDRVLEERLRYAVTECAAFDLDEL